MNYCWVSSPIGELLAAEAGGAIRILRFATGARGLTGTAHGEPLASWREVSPDRGVLGELRRQLDRYFAGRLEKFELPLDPRGTAFQRAVWSGLQRIPYGDRLSYGELAKRIGRPRAVRAVGAANGANPIPIVIPCHRVVGSTGKLTGFGGGLETKRALLDLEARVVGGTP